MGSKIKWGWEKVVNAKKICDYVKYIQNRGIEMKGGFSLIVFTVLIAIGFYRYINTPESLRTDLSKKYFLKFILGTISLCLGILLFDIVDRLITFLLVMFGFYGALFNGINLFAENPNKNNAPNTLKVIKPIEKLQQQLVVKNSSKPTVNSENFDKPKYLGNVRCAKCGHIDKAISFSASTLGDNFRKCYICNEDFNFMSRYNSTKTYIGNYRCNVCNYQDEEKNFLESSAGDKFKQCHMCGGHFQIK